MSMARWNPFRNRAARHSDRERLFADYWRTVLGNLSFDENALVIDVREAERVYIVTIELPDALAENIRVRLDGDYLLIAGGVADDTVEQHEDRRAQVQARRCASFSRAIRLPLTVDSSRSEAKFEKGVLTLTLPKVATATSRTIPVKDNMQ